jgi:hypothetical protein
MTETEFKQVRTASLEPTEDELPSEITELSPTPALVSAGPVHFYDAATPSNVPGNVFAAYYVNGFVWPAYQIKRMYRVIAVSVRHDRGWARVARCIDVENGAAYPSDVVPFIRARIGYGHHDATAYVNRSNWQIVHDLVRKAGLNCRYWVSTLDGTMHPVLPDGTVPWAVQYQGGMNAPYDKSILWGRNDFLKP